MRAGGELFSDIAQVVNGAASALGGVREELRGMRQGYQERSQNAGSIVTREDFDAAISRIEALAARITVLEAQLAKHNPIDRLAPLAKAKVPIFHIHGDMDRVVPLDKNSAIIKDRYDKLGGPMILEIVKGQGHNMWPGWFQSQALVDFVLKHAKESAR